MTADRTRRNMLGAGLAVLLVPALARAQPQCRATPRDALGPFYKPKAPAQADLCASGSGTRKLVVTGRVLGMPDCKPLAGALVEVWQADEAGHYSQVGSKQDDAGCLLRASITTDRAGQYRFVTVLPGEYPGRPRHIHYRVSHAGYAPLVTQLYFERHRGVPDALVASVAAVPQESAQTAFDITLPAM